MRPTSDIDELKRMRPLARWHEGHGDVLWWVVPVSEAPYCGTPNDDDWPGYHTHWSPLPNVVCPIMGPINANER